MKRVVIVWLDRQNLACTAEGVLILSWKAWRISKVWVIFFRLHKHLMLIAEKLAYTEKYKEEKKMTSKPRLTK